MFTVTVPPRDFGGLLEVTDDQALRVALHQRYADRYEAVIDSDSLSTLIYCLQHLSPSICDTFETWAAEFIENLAWQHDIHQATP